MIEVYTANTPNGVKVPIALEELGLAYRIIKVNLSAGEQKHPEFLLISPNGRIPAIVDSQGPLGQPVSLFESGAILLYLSKKAEEKAEEKAREKMAANAAEQTRHSPGLLPAHPVERLRALEYLFLQVGGIGPMFGQSAWFLRSAPEPVSFAQERYRNESLRLTGVLEARLREQPWLAGSQYSIADIMNFSWLRVADYAGIDLGRFPAVQAWVARIAARPAVQRGLAALA